MTPLPIPREKMYTEEQRGSLHLAKRRLGQTGKPEVVARINHLMAQEAPYESIWAIANADVEEMVKPEKPTEIYPPPPLFGKGSGTEAWQKFASQVSDMDPEVIESMGRNDLVRVLVDRGIIPEPNYILGE